MFFNYENYFLGQLKGFIYGVKASFQDGFGKTGNFFTSLFTKSQVDFYAEVEAAFGPISYSGKLTVKTDGEITLQFSNPTDMLIGEIEKIANLPVAIDMSGLTTELPLYKGLVDVNAVVGVSFDENNNIQLKLGVKAGKEVTTPIPGQTLGASVGAGLNITFNPSSQDGPFGTAENAKGNNLNETLQKYIYYNSVDFYLQNMQ